ncbi:carboxyl transferase domain-containing protein [Phenylobacterium sp. J426]|uniref:carboxyl transferase domain-containing protein n=1 Tax=Phenylobacterium sp. J426 TaxID=2898439 RepID=UPI0021515608|nr:carboxyl transferase domain-containing protein [Phenylobacterium sp. J426]
MRCRSSASTAPRRTSPSCRTSWLIRRSRPATCIPASSRSTWASWPIRPRRIRSSISTPRLAARRPGGPRRQRRPQGTTPLKAPLQGTVIGLQAQVGDAVRAGQALMILEAMKMEHVVAAEASGVLRQVVAQLGDTVFEGDAVAFLEPTGDGDAAQAAEQAIDLDAIRPDLAEVIERHRLTLDAARPDAVARRRRTGQRTARENVDDLFDPGSFSEYGAMAVAAQRRRRTLDDLRANTPADGIITGVGAVNGHLFDEERARCVGLAYDFTVLAGTQGHFNHKKTDRILEFAEHWKAPVIWYTEGGGGRPGDVDGGQLSASSLDTTSFTTFARLSGLAPRISINSGRCFAGNAIFFGCADITIATRYSNIGLGGPAMIEGGGPGRLHAGRDRAVGRALRQRGDRRAGAG